MKKLLLLVLVALPTFLFSQSWVSSYNLSGDNDIFVISSISDHQGNILILGYFTGTLTTIELGEISSFGGRDYFLAKFDADNNLTWLKNIGSRYNDNVNGGICVDDEDNIYVSGAFTNYLLISPSDSIQSTGSDDIFLINFDSNGSVNWASNIGMGAKPQRPSALNYDSNTGELLIAGIFFDSIRFNNDVTLFQKNNYKDYFYAKLNSTDGSVVWAKSVNAINGPASGRINEFLVDEDNYYLTGYFADSVGFDSDTLVAEGSLKYDIHMMKTNLSGEIEWIRKVQGADHDYSYDLAFDSQENIYISGYYSSDTLYFDSTETETIAIDHHVGGLDFFIAKYSKDGNLLWNKQAGGLFDDKLFSMEFFNGEVHVAGYFTDSIKWGGITLKTSGNLDTDYFVGSMDTEGNFRSANSFAGRNNSWEECFGTFSFGDKLYSIIRSNSDLLVLGDSIYTNSGEHFYLVMGVIGCAPISIDQVITQDVQTCYGDSTGAIQILASGGFGAPWQYSIDNGLNYEPLAYFADLPAGDYPIVVIDAENCAQPGPTETVTQPEPLSLELVSEEFTGDSMVNIVVAAYGGTPPYTYTLQPNGIIQGFGNFSVKWSEPGYYIVEVNDISNCGPVVTDTLTTSSGIDLFAPGVKLFPNPTSGIITVEVPFQGTTCTLEVLSLTGQVMLSRQVYSNGISINETIDISELSKGMYMIRVDGQTLKSGVVLN